MERQGNSKCKINVLVSKKIVLPLLKEPASLTTFHFKINVLVSKKIVLPLFKK